MICELYMALQILQREFSRKLGQITCGLCTAVKQKRANYLSNNNTNTFSVLLFVLFLNNTLLKLGYVFCTVYVIVIEVVD